MSRIGRKAIKIPQGVDVIVQETGVLKIKGPKGELIQNLHPLIEVVVQNGEVRVFPKGKSKLARSLHGTLARLVFNMIEGVTSGHKKNLEIHGVGYRATVQGNQLVLNVGFSHPVTLVVPEGLDIKVQKNVISVSGIDKQKVGQFAAIVRKVRPPEPYKGKGIRYQSELVRRKVGKAAKATGAA